MLSKEFQIIVGIPSYNEEETISYVTRTIDRGLVKYFPDYKSLIVNIDQSADHTKEAFLETGTRTPKAFIYTGPTIGKGKSLLRLLDFVLPPHEVKYLCSIDSDVSSVQEDWIGKLFTPLIKEEADYVLPLYVRNRYEANTTNHFCVPILNACFSSEIRQPIAGEFAMNQSVAEYLVTRSRNPETDEYGIDIFFTMNAVGKGFRTKEVHLGEKVHNPSFGKMVPMFRQVASTTFYVMEQYKRNFFQKQLRDQNELSTQYIGIGDDAIKPAQEAIDKRRRYAHEQLEELLKEPNEGIIPLNKGLIEDVIKKSDLGSELWVEVLYRFIQHIVDNDISHTESTRMSHLITPFYLMRVLSYYKEIEDLPPEKIEDLILYQKGLLTQRFNSQI